MAGYTGMACEGVKQVLTESEGPQQSIPDIGHSWPADDCITGQRVRQPDGILCVYLCFET